ncbi:MAG: anti-sigma factor antagonist [Acidobacteria bacterium]|nr:MAG: anti-sigma factor antagonist [Acidobacteriota bacterium]
MEIRCRLIDGVTILDLEGKIRIGAETQALRSQIQALSSVGVRSLLLNLTKISEIDSCGIGELVVAYTSMTKRGGVVKLLGLNPRVHSLMSMTKLLTLFEVFNDEKAAVESFG